ncbi:hypothetical protein D1007_47433 [Hordeum vulgare]|nr:hypothetical protein D1007_47433 [Hordeum vulgare]
MSAPASYSLSSVAAIGSLVGPLSSARRSSTSAVLPASLRPDDPDEVLLDVPKNGVSTPEALDMSVNSLIELTVEGNDLTDKDSLEDGANPIDELDKANFAKNNTSGSATSNKQKTEFHPQFMSDGDHEAFVKEIKSCGLMANNPGDIMDDMLDSPMRISPPLGGILMSAHMDYCSEHLKKFDMAESDEECVDKLPEMQCLPDEMIKNFSSTKRSLLDTLEQTESEKKGKFQEESTKWGPVLSIRPTTRGHGGHQYYG